MASFSASTKAEICRNIPKKQCCARAMCFGILLFCNQFSAEGIRVITECRDLAENLPELFRRAFGISALPAEQRTSAGKAAFRIADADVISRIMQQFGFDPKDTLSMHINLPVVEEECCKNAFLRGAFLAGGSVTDPAKRYHLELATTHKSVAREGYSLVEEVLGLSLKTVSRSGGQVLYLKQSDQIADLLTYLGAPVAAMGIIEAKLEKELNNRVNRRCNCDEANTSKIVEASQEQLTAIRTIRENGLWQQLPTKLQQAALAREENPELSLSELAVMMEPPISKPAMNNRMKKLINLAREVSL